MDFDGIVAIIALGVSGVTAWLTSIKSAALTREQEKLQAELSKEAASAESKRYFSVLWDKFAELQHIDTSRPAPEQVRRVSNVLSLVSVCWQAGVVDKEMVVLALGPFFIELVDEIRSIQQVLPNLNMNGPTILMHSSEIEVVYGEIKTVLQQRRGTLSGGTK